MPVIPRETKSQRASAAKPKYTFDFSEEEGDEDEENGDDDVVSSPMRSSFKEDFPSSEPKPSFSLDDEDDDDEDCFSPPKKTT
ncbi:hypothetical protein KUCAC02_025083 [Chaenocephalus aceratus]|nr:hypothetical protein KUCAC02_025083 [Chaenocephalus aceratus]